MRDSLKQRCELFIANRDTIKSVFSWENTYIVHVCASVFTSKGICIDEAKLKDCKKILKENTGVFSNFRSNVRLPVVSLLALSNVPQQHMLKINKFYSAMKSYFSGSEYLAYAAAVLADLSELSDIDTLSARGKAIYKLMKKEHPMLTSYEDSVFAALMAFSEKSNDDLIFDMETCYQLLKRQVSDKNALQSLSHVIALAGGNIEENSQRVMDIFYALKEQGRKYSKYYELSALGALAVLPVELNTVVEDILQVDSFLDAQKGYGFWGVEKKTRLMHAVMIVCGEYSASDDVSAAAITATLAMVAAQQAATTAVIVASSASMAASSN